jgi:hypothetical protein
VTAGTTRYALEKTATTQTSASETAAAARRCPVSRRVADASEKT